METFNGESNWKLTVRRGPDGLAILRALTCDRRAALPDSVHGVPVTEIASRALSPNAPDLDGDVIRMACGPASGAWDNQSMTDLRLPSGLRRVGDYALYNCRALERLRVRDNGAAWGSGAFVNCRSLRDIEIFQSDGDKGAFAYFAGELNREIEIAITRPRNNDKFMITNQPINNNFAITNPDNNAIIAFRILFPEYRELYEENCPAHHFDYAIEGVGYPYRHCFRERRFSFAEYDALWDKSPGMETQTALRLAWLRLRYPEGLSDAAAQRYREYLRTRFKEASAALIAKRDAPGLAFLLRITSPERADLAYASALAREQSFPEALALLLDAQRKRYPVRDASRFAL